MALAFVNPIAVPKVTGTALVKNCLRVCFVIVIMVLRGIKVYNKNRKIKIARSSVNGLKSSDLSNSAFTVKLSRLLVVMM